MFQFTKKPSSGSLRQYLG